MTGSARVELADEAQTRAFGARLAAALALLPADQPFVVYLEGDLGSGKTTLVRAMLRSRGVTGAVKSPTYTLVEPYEVEARRWYHLDLYRVGHPEELEFLGLTDWLAENALLLVEWPARGSGMLPPAQLRLVLTVRAADARSVEMETDSKALLQALEGLTEFSFKSVD
ncbi:MAG: tRNA (adenosine(37)-N6)-threonylcarbamoyltransferase complex ATPase subunit type 1 TsaE [Pseudomonadota bacterium]